MPRVPVLGVLRLYKTHLSPELRSRTCRFTPSCSLYAHEAISRFGVIRGGMLSYRRVRRCAPEYPGGYDPVPETAPR
ncbi:MAG: membrane protein insertion efficiency factor YidD [Methylococcaceae bacterium]